MIYVGSSVHQLDSLFRTENVAENQFAAAFHISKCDLGQLSRTEPTVRIPCKRQELTAIEAGEVARIEPHLHATPTTRHFVNSFPSNS